MSDIVNPVTKDGRVGYDKFGQFCHWTEPDKSGRCEGRFIADVRDKTCRICGNGWESTADSLINQTHWQLIEEHVHESCLARHWGLVERAEYQAVINQLMIPYSVKELPDGYRGSGSPRSRPWYLFSFGRHPVVLVIGRRKHVHAISMLPTEDTSLDWHGQAEDAFRDEKVTKTFSSEGIHVHAWSTEDVYRYTKMLMGFVPEKSEDVCTRRAEES